VKVHLPSGRVVSVPASVAAAATTLADFCPDRAEHTPPQDKRRYEATVHPTCGLEVVWVRKAGRRRA
jgi:hypothetical protein